MLKSVIARLQNPLSSVLHIGAGMGNDLALYQAVGVDQIVMAEADPQLAAELRARLVGVPQVKVVQAAVSGDPEPRPFFITNFPELNSLRRPRALRDLFPGLRILSEKPVTPISPAELIPEQAEDTTAARLLVLETPGEALSILQALAAAEELQSFAAICLREDRSPLYDGAPALAEIRNWLEDADYRTEEEQQPADADRPWIAAFADPVRHTQRRALAALQQRLDAAAQTGDAARQEAERLGAELSAAKARSEQLLREHDIAQQQIKTQKATINTLTQTRDAALTEAERLAKDLTAAQARSEALAQERDALRETAAQQRSSGRDEIRKAEGQMRLLRDLLLNRDSP